MPHSFAELRSALMAHIKSQRNNDEWYDPALNELVTALIDMDKRLEEGKEALILQAIRAGAVSKTLGEIKISACPCGKNGTHYCDL